MPEMTTAIDHQIKCESTPVTVTGASLCLPVHSMGSRTMSLNAWATILGTSDPVKYASAPSRALPIKNGTATASTVTKSPCVHPCPK
jgi:polygalacturonase